MNAPNILKKRVLFRPKRIPLRLKTRYDIVPGSKRGAGGGEVRPAAASSWIAIRGGDAGSNTQGGFVSAPEANPAQARCCGQHHGHRDRVLRTLPYAARHRYRRGHRGHQADRAAPDRAGGAVRGGGLFHPDILRPVRGSRDRPHRYSLPRQRARRLHLLFDRAQCRRQRLHRRRGALSHLFGVGTERDRRRQDLLSGRPDVLARQCRGAGTRHRLSSGSGRRDRPAAALAEPRRRVRHHRSGWWPMWSGSGCSRAGSAAGPGP